METKEFIKKVASPYLWGNLMGMAAVIVGLVLILVLSASAYTHHGEKISVPDVRKHSEESATKVLENLGFVVEVLDTVYIPKMKPGQVVEQSPIPGAVCKSGRIIYLTINALDVPVLTIPDLIDNSSYREAKAKLEAHGFKLGEPEYVPGEKDWVYGMKVRGRNLSAGDQITVDDVVIIQVGSGRLDASDSTIVETHVHYQPQDDMLENQGPDEFEEIILE